jgi:alpha-tubulin suppressor-like RCC1 family protein
MAVLNTGCLISTIQADITGLTTGSQAECFVIVAGAVDVATQDRCVTVPNTGSLPSLWPIQTIPQGQVLFVEDIGIPVIAASGRWIGFDQRSVKKESPNCILYTWGYNAQGQIGDGTTTSRTSPVTPVREVTNWCFISAGGYTSAGIKTDGTLWTWGSNSFGRLGNGTTVDNYFPATTAGGGTNWCFVSPGKDHTAAIKTDGTLWTWGSNIAGGLGDGTTTSRCSPGTTAGGGTNWCAVKAANCFTVAIKTDGTLWAWGLNSQGALGDGTSISKTSPVTTAGGGNNWRTVTAGDSWTAAIKTDGTLWTWGNNSSGFLGDNTITNRCSPGTTIAGGSDWCLVSAGRCHTSAIKTDGTLWGWGLNIQGQIGDGTIVSRSSPVTVAGGGTTWCGVAASRHTIAVKTDGTLWTWGYNGAGRLGTGNQTNRSSPGTTLGCGTDWKLVSAGNFSIALKGS